MQRPEPDPRRTGVRLTRTVFQDEDGCLPSHAEPGQCETGKDYILLACPGCGSVSSMSVGSPKPGRSPSWEITAGNLGDQLEHLTLSPSVNCTGCCSWHGWLKDGVFHIY